MASRIQPKFDAFIRLDKAEQIAQIKKTVNEFGMIGAAKVLGIAYQRFLNLRKELGLTVKHGSNQTTSAAFRWTRKKPFNVVTSNYYLSYRSGAKSRKLDFELTLEQYQIIAKQSCFYCGSLEARIVKVAHRFYRTKFNGIDRVDNSKGYIFDNCVPCCSTCNYAKHQLTTNQFINWINRLIKFNIAK